MEPALWAAKTGLDAQQTQMTVTANNLANVATNGFKRSRAVFDGAAARHRRTRRLH
jgi:flagellar basal-body rod protein FlgG